MKFRVVMRVANPTREITTCFAGCKDADDAKTKARGVFAVLTFKTVEESKQAKTQVKTRKIEEPVVSYAGTETPF